MRLEEHVGWSKTDHDVLDKINELIENARRTPFTGLGKPEPARP